MNKASSMSIAAVVALTLSGSVYAQSNNTLATPSTVSPAANTTSGYGTPAATSSDSGAGTASANSSQQKSTSDNSTPGTSAFGANNTLATPSTVSPAK
ncbi:hypothetical protein VSR68_27675 [Paraburkholderia phymatum]|uniref:hypothetical protein n=1 Tax=Paraburkholderia phymatum TaxID=148447 RepID=UPI0031734986